MEAWALLTLSGKFVCLFAFCSSLVQLGWVAHDLHDCHSMDDGTQRMYYTGQSADGSTAIGVAKLKAETVQWERELANFALVSSA